MLPSKKAAYYNILIVVAATLLILARQGQREGDTSFHEYMLTKESADDHYRTEGLVDEQHANYEPIYAEQESEKLLAAQQADEDILAIRQAFTGFEEILAKEQEVLSEQDNEKMLHEHVEQDDDQELAEIEENCEEEESLDSSQIEELNYQLYSNELDNEIRVDQMESNKDKAEIEDDKIFTTEQGNKKNMTDIDFGNSLDVSYAYSVSIKMSSYLQNNFVMFFYDH